MIPPISGQFRREGRNSLFSFNTLATGGCTSRLSVPEGRFVRSGPFRDNVRALIEPEVDLFLYGATEIFAANAAQDPSTTHNRIANSRRTFPTAINAEQQSL
jgi:hypothetical protein